MRILIDATPMLLRSVGIKTYLYHWIQHLCQQAGNEQILTFPRLDKLAPLNHERSILTPAETFPKLALLHFANLSPTLAGWATPKADVFHVSNQIRNPPKKTKLTATIYDLTCRLMPELHTAANIRADESLARNVLQKADALIAISENTRADAIRLLGLDPRTCTRHLSRRSGSLFRSATKTGRASICFICGDHRAAQECRYAAGCLAGFPVA